MDDTARRLLGLRDPQRSRRQAERDLLPWLQRASAFLRTKGILVSSHTNGENEGLLDLIDRSGIDVAKAVCPHPMTKVPIREYYRRRGDRMAIFGGIPSNLVLADTTSERDFEAHRDSPFEAIAPGRRFILGVADNVPPATVYDRLLRISGRVRRDGRLPIGAPGGQAKGAALA